MLIRKNKNYTFLFLFRSRSTVFFLKHVSLRPHFSGAESKEDAALVSVTNAYENKFVMGK